MASEVEETLKRLVSHKGVIGTIVVNNEGVRKIIILFNTAFFVSKVTHWDHFGPTKFLW